MAVIDDEAFARGRHNIEEGGPKGLAIDRTGELVAIACEEQPLAIHALRTMTGASRQAMDSAARKEGGGTSLVGHLAAT